MDDPRVTRFLRQVSEWASGQDRIQGVALVGSHARGAATTGSDVDLVVLAHNPQSYLVDQSWILLFGQVQHHDTEHYGNVVSLRVYYESGFEVEFGLTDPDWAAVPLDPGTRQVVSRGMKVLFERGTLLSRHAHRAEAMSIEIAVFRPEHTNRFAELNREWLEKYHLMEQPDEEQLADPQTHFLTNGGQIFVALHAGKVIGTCAAVPHGLDEFEIAKLAVDAEFRGQGIARRLVERCIAYVRERKARRITLVSNSQLQAALRLYQSLGFRFCEVPEVRAYVNADVYMELSLEIPDHGSRVPT